MFDFGLTNVGSRRVLVEPSRILFAFGTVVSLGKILLNWP